jgi:alpha-galactosidase
MAVYPPPPPPSVLIEAVADAFVSLGLKSAGYSFINVDDGWMVSRDANGAIVADPVKFPSGMKALAAKVHARGLKFGLYTSATEFTCQKRPGSWQYEAEDVK